MPVRMGVRMVVDVLVRVVVRVDVARGRTHARILAVRADSDESPQWLHAQSMRLRRSPTSSTSDSSTCSPTMISNP